MTPDGLTTWLEIDLSAIHNNVRRLRALSYVPLMAVVKANAYGHGLVEVSRAVLQARAAWLAVARFEEALVLRQAGIAEPILVLGYTHPACAAEAAAKAIRLCLFDPETLEDYASAAHLAGRKLIVHLKIDSGMGRLGVPPEEGVEFLRRAASLPGLDVEGIFTHFARSDEQDVPATAAQLAAFTSVITALEDAGLRPPLAHASNTAAALTLPDARFNLVRGGIAIYGLDPSPECPLPPGFRPALSWKCRLASVKSLPAGHGVGYGHWYVTPHAERIGVIPVGYADGLRRLVPNEVLIRGQRLPLLPRICMDQALLRLSDLPDAQAGDEVVLIGRQGSECITAEEVAARWKTNNYDVVSGLSARLPRLYLNNEPSIQETLHAAQ